MDVLTLVVSGPQIPCQMWFDNLVSLPNTDEGPIRDGEAPKPTPQLRDAKHPSPSDLQAGRAATEAVTRLWKPSVWRAPHRRPQVKARN